MIAAVSEFTLHVSDVRIAELNERLERTRFPDQAPEAPWTYGTDLGFMQHAVQYWAHEFDWRTAESRLNRFPQYRVHLEGIDLHYLHVPGQGPDPVPLLLCHGWPGSVFEFLDLIPRLTDPARFGGRAEDAMTVIAPSLPGFGLSFAPGQPRIGASGMATLFARLMTDVLGYERFLVQGGDWGAFITSRIAVDHPERVIGLHLNFLPLRRDMTSLSDPTAEEGRYLKELERFLAEETGYQWIQGTRPQTLAYGLVDSPAGLAGWIFEKFHAWTDCEGDIEKAISLDAALANISLYWFTGCIGASFHPYYERKHAGWPIPDNAHVVVPTAYVQFPKEILRPPRSLAEQVYRDIRRWTVMERGGHFAALEQPDALAANIRAFRGAL